MRVFRAMNLRLLTLALTASLIVGLVSSATAAAPNLQPLTPGKGATVARKSTPAFKVRISKSFSGPFGVFVVVSRSNATINGGIIKNAGTVFFSQMTRQQGRIFAARPKRYSFPAYWLNQGGTYYWQAYVIKCKPGNTTDCNQEGPVRKLKVS